ncbi:MAG: hypothetical protein AB7K86_20950 [Rhodospirillales bacterium]
MQFRVTACAFALATLTAAASGAASAAGLKEMVYSSYAPPKHAMNAYGIAPLLEELTAAGIPWKLVTGGQMFSAQNTLKGIGNRTADGGGPVVTPYTRSELKHANLIGDLMMFGSSGLAMTGAALETFFLGACPGCIDDFKKNGVTYLSGFGSGGYALMCNKPVKTVADVAGKKVRTTGALGRWAKSMGATPVNMTAGDMVEAMARGQIDCIMGPMAWLKSYPLEDSVTHIYDYDLGALAGIGLFNINNKVWEGYDDAQKRRIWAAQPAAIARTVVLGYIGDNERSRKVAKARGIVMSPQDEAVRVLWAEHKKEDYDAAVKHAAKLQVEAPEKIADAFIAAIAKWNKLVDGPKLHEKIAAADADEAKLAEVAKAFEAMLRDEIYAKADPSKL